MTVRINTLALLGLVPQANPLYRQAFDGVGVLESFGVLDNPLRSEHFLAQLLHESGGMRLLTEDLSYSAKRLTEVWPSRFPTQAAAEPFARNPRALANRVYGGRMGNIEPEDGWTFIGRGFLQLTGRENYARIGAMLGIDLEQHPSYALLPEYSLQIAAAVWGSAGCNGHADRDDLPAVTKAINGGFNGLVYRRGWIARVRAAGVVKP